MKIHLLRETWSHMAAVSGFDPLFAALQSRWGSKALSHHVPAVLPKKGWLDKGLAKFGWRSGWATTSKPVSPFVEPRHQELAFHLLRHLQASPEDILLMSVGENQFAPALADAPRKLRRRMFVFLHQPPAWFRLHWLDGRALDGLGGIFALCREQAEFFRSFVDSPVHEIRHGVCLDHFCPGQVENGCRPRYLFVGQWLRDFRTLSEIVPLILNRHPSAEFDLAIPRAARHHESLQALARDFRVHWHSGLSAESLRDLYRSSRVLVLPLLDSTANNAILEAMACALPVVSTDVGGTRDYLKDGLGVLCPQGNAGAHAEAALTIGHSDAAVTQIGRHARSYAEANLSWETIASEIAGIVGGKSTVLRGLT